MFADQLAPGPVAEGASWRPQVSGVRRLACIDAGPTPTHAPDGSARSCARTSGPSHTVSGCDARRSGNRTFGGRQAQVRSRHGLTAFEHPRDYGEHFKARYGPTIVARANASSTGREAESDDALDRFCDEWNRGTAEQARFEKEYLLAVGTRT